MTTRHLVIATKLGPMTLVASGDAISGLYFARHIRRPSDDEFGPCVVASTDPLLERAAGQLIEYLGGTRRTFELPLTAAGTEFQQSVWALVGEIPFGETTSYGAIAAALGSPGRAYEVGQAVAANPLCILVPCHRVVGATGALTGYAGGLARKRALLELEKPTAIAAGGLF